MHFYVFTILKLCFSVFDLQYYLLQEPANSSRVFQQLPQNNSPCQQQLLGGGQYPQQPLNNLISSQAAGYQNSGHVMENQIHRNQCDQGQFRYANNNGLLPWHHQTINYNNDAYGLHQSSNQDWSQNGFHQNSTSYTNPIQHPYAQVNSPHHKSKLLQYSYIMMRGKHLTTG